MNKRPTCLIAHSYYLRLDRKQWDRQEPYQPLATLLTAAVLRNQGHEVVFFDAMLADGVSEFINLIDDVHPRFVLLVEDNFNYLTKMCTTQMRDAAVAMIGAAKGAGCHVAVNGSDAADRPGTYLSAGADAVIVGEPERTAVDLLEAWLDGRAALDSVPGLALPAPPGADLPPVVYTPARSAISQLDDLPMPAWDLADVGRYADVWNTAHDRFSWNLVASRGCPYRCNWCAKPIFGTRYAQRSPRSLADELAHVVERYRPDHVWYADDIFGLTGEWMESFAVEVNRRNANVPFKMQSRANLMKPGVVDALSSAGAEEVWLGAESGSQRILDDMDKGTTVQQVRDATRRLQAAGIKVGWFIQLGYPGEEWSDILTTRDLIRDERPDDIGVSVAYPLPGTKFFERVKQELGAKTNWEDSAELAMMFRGTYSTSFYRRVRNLLHDEIDGRIPTDLDLMWRELAHSRGDLPPKSIAKAP